MSEKSLGALTTSGIGAAVARREWLRQTGLMTPIEVDEKAAGLTMEEALYAELYEANFGADFTTRAAEIITLARHLGCDSDRLIDRAKSIGGYGPTNGRVAFDVATARSLDELRAAWAQLRQAGEADLRYQRMFRQRAAELAGGAR